MNIVRFNANDAPVIGYLHEDHDRLVAHKTRPALIVCAGGGYNHVSKRESDPAALRFLALGYQTFLLEYSVEEKAGALRPLKELAATVRILRERAEEWRIEPEHIAVMGFSAGGHLAASLGILWDHPALGLGAESRPDALILGYPVITTGPFGHAESARNVSGGDADLMALLSLEKQVTKSMPPTFLWHCLGDETVPAENALMLAAAMRQAGVPFELHLFEEGAHGISVGTQETETLWPDLQIWVHLSQTWLNKRFQFIP